MAIRYHTIDAHRVNAYIATPGTDIDGKTLNTHALVVGDKADRIVITGDLDRLLQLGAGLEVDPSSLGQAYTVVGVLDDNQLIIAGVFEGDHAPEDTATHSHSYGRYATVVWAEDADQAEAFALAQHEQACAQ